jgi:hypothetical protein
MLEKTYYFLIKLVKTAISLLRIVLFSKKTRLPDCKTSESCVILGNGPSLKDTISGHFDFLQKQDLIAVNFFVNSEFYEKLQPQYYMLTAVDFWLQKVDDEREKNRMILFHNIAQKTTWNLVLCIPHIAKQAHHWQDILLPNTHLKIVYINQTVVEGFPSINHILYKKNLGMPRPHNVLVPSLMFAVNSGYKKIYLVGADHSWLPTIRVTDDNEAVLVQQHFYDKHKVQEKPMKTLIIGEKRPLHMILHKLMLAFRGYFEIDAYSKKRGVEIVNATPDSFIDAFKRVKL